MISSTSSYKRNHVRCVLVLRGANRHVALGFVNPVHSCERLLDLNIDVRVGIYDRRTDTERFTSSIPVATKTMRHVFVLTKAIPCCAFGIVLLIHDACASPKTLGLGNLTLHRTLESQEVLSLMLCVECRRNGRKLSCRFADRSR